MRPAAAAGATTREMNLTKQPHVIDRNYESSIKATLNCVRASAVLLILALFSRKSPEVRYFGACAYNLTAPCLDSSQSQALTSGDTRKVRRIFSLLEIQISILIR
jgi:hypothetical protein